MIAGARKSGISRSAKRSSVQIETRAANSIFKGILNLSNKLYVAVYRKETYVPDTFGYELHAVVHFRMQAANIATIR